MTHIVAFSTKKAFKEAVAIAPQNVYLRDPSIFNPVSGSVTEVMEKVSHITVTNHPKRSWFAEVIRKGDKLMVR